MLRAYQCPFFRWEEKRIIHCEAGTLSFPDLEAMCDYIDKYCANHPHWQNCSIAQNREFIYERKCKDGARH